MMVCNGLLMRRKVINSAKVVTKIAGDPAEDMGVI